MSGSSYRPRPDNGSGGSPRPPFLTEFVNHIREVFFAHAIYHLIGGTLTPRVHPHVEWAGRLKTESAFRIIQLHRAQSQVGQQTVRTRGPYMLSDFSVRALKQCDDRTLCPGFLKPLTGQLHRSRAFIEANQMPLWAEAPCDF